MKERKEEEESRRTPRFHGDHREGEQEERKPGISFPLRILREEFRAF
jgi:hypothetical protein